MVQTWDNDDKYEKISCPKCTTKYWLGCRRFPIKDSGFVYCKNCGHLLKEWRNDTHDFYLGSIVEEE